LTSVFAEARRTDPVLPQTILDHSVRARALDWLDARGIRLPTLGELAVPATIDASVAGRVREVPAGATDALNLFRLHWYNEPDGGVAEVPPHVVLEPEMIGVETPIIVLIGDHFPLIGAHKVLPAYAVLVARIVSGGFDPSSDRAIWPSTGNYCRGGVAISRLLGCRSAAVLPEGMSRERFDWLEAWVGDPADIIRTPGTESNVKEIYDRCRELAAEPGNVVLNQFSEFANYVAHERCTGHAATVAFDHYRARRANAQLRAFVAASGSSGTLAAGDHLKSVYGSATAVVEALECPTLLRNGFGEHNIQGIGDKHVPLIHNVMSTDYVIGISDQATDDLNVVLNAPAGRDHLRRLGVSQEIVDALPSFGLSSICNILAAIRLARHAGWGPDDVIVTIATDGAPMYDSERRRHERAAFADGVDDAAVARSLREHLGSGEVLELSNTDRDRIFNLGYYTWVEQQDVPLDFFVARRESSFWAAVRRRGERLDDMIAAFNREAGRDEA
jgi:cysteine synthase